MTISKTVQAGVVNLTNRKRRELEKEYRNLQRYLQGEEDVELYSANKQQADRFYEDIKEDQEYPISVRKDLIEIRKCDSDVADYFVKIPTAQRYGGLKVPVRVNKEIGEDWEIRESKVIRKNSRFYINIAVSHEEPAHIDAEGMVGIDLGLKRPVTGVILSVADRKVRDVFFKGKDIQQTQSRYAYLRRSSSTGKRWRKKEKDKVRDYLHKITTAIADKAEEENLAVSVGNLEGVQKQDKGREANRKLQKFPHYRFRKMLEYKCRERGVQYFEVNEAYTTKTCYKCGEHADDVTPHEVRCNGSKINRDVNGAANIAKRALTKAETSPLGSAGV